MNRSMPLGIKIISGIYGFWALLCLSFGALFLFLVMFGEVSGTNPELGRQILSVFGVLLAITGALQLTLSVGLWRGNRIALFLALFLSGISVFASIIGAAASALDLFLLPNTLFHLGVVVYFILSREARAAFAD